MSAAEERQEWRELAEAATEYKPDAPATMWGWAKGLAAAVPALLADVDALTAERDAMAAELAQVRAQLATATAATIENAPQWFLDAVSTMQTQANAEWQEEHAARLVLAEQLKAAEAQTLFWWNEATKPELEPQA